MGTCLWRHFKPEQLVGGLACKTPPETKSTALLRDLLAKTILEGRHCSAGTRGSIYTHKNPPDVSRQDIKNARAEHCRGLSLGKGSTIQPRVGNPKISRTSFKVSINLRQTVVLPSVPGPTCKCYIPRTRSLTSLPPNVILFPSLTAAMMGAMAAVPLRDRQALCETPFCNTDPRPLPRSSQGPDTHTGRPSSFALSTKKFPFLKWSCNKEKAHTISDADGAVCLSFLRKGSAFCYLLTIIKMH